MTPSIARTNLTNLWEWVKAKQNTGGDTVEKIITFLAGYCSTGRVQHANPAERSTSIIDVLSKK